MKATLKIHSDANPDDQMAEHDGNLPGQKDMSHLEMLTRSGVSCLLNAWLYSLDVQLTYICACTFSDIFKGTN